MRLINTETLRLEDWSDQNLPPYAILSHRWYSDEQEVSFRDLQNAVDVTHKKGYVKLRRFCEVARYLHYAYAWSDVCCINKDSDNELKTALNTMYRWYANSSLCIAYLEDVYGPGDSFEHSEWFSRGWTLQELIAPKRMYFYDSSWNFIGEKSQLIDRLSRITKVQESILSHRAEPNSCSIAQRMSWAAGRVTKRVEDRAYSLLGIFGITMETVYDGNGERAFFQLQKNIIESSADQSIFAWPMDKFNHPLRWAGMFAPSPDSFATCGNIFSAGDTIGFRLENIGLSITLPTVPYAMHTYLALLECSQAETSGRRLAILITKHADSERYTRIAVDSGNGLFAPESEALAANHPVMRQLYIQSAPANLQLCARRAYGIRIRHLSAFRSARKVRLLSRTPIRAEGQLCLMPGLAGTAGVISVEPAPVRWGGFVRQWAAVRWIKIGFDHNFNLKIMLSRADAARNATVDPREFEKAAGSKLGSRAEARVFQNNWLSRKSGPVPSHKDLWESGYYVLTPDFLPRENETIVYNQFEDLNIQIQLSLLRVSRPLAVACSGASKTPAFIWTIDFLRSSSYRSAGYSYFSRRLADFTPKEQPVI